MFTALLFSLISTASASDSPSLWARQLVGLGGWPTGAISDTRVQYRTPGPRSDSVLFQDTYFGVGGRLQVSPAFIDIGPRLSIAPIDIFDMDVQGSWTGYAGPFAPLAMNGLDGRIQSARNERKGEQMPMSKLELSVTPTLKAKVGPIIAFDSMNISKVRASRPEGVTENYFYEPYRDMVLAWNDTNFEHQGAAVYEIMDGQDKAKLWVGGTARHRFALQSKDNTTTAGALVVWKPGTAKATPTILGQAMFYVADNERVGTAPNVNVAAIWQFDKPLELKEAVR